MQRFISTIAILFFLSVSWVQSQVVGELTIENQSVSGTDFFFDIYLKRATVSPDGDLYLGNADFVLTFNSANFSGPALTKVDQTVCGFLNPGYNTFISTSYTDPNDCATSVNVVQQGYFNNTVVPAIIGNELVINLNGIAFSNQTEFDQKIAKIDNVAVTYRLGRFKLSGISNSSGTADLMWKTSGGGSETKVFSLLNVDPWTSTQIDLIATNPPAAPLPIEVAYFLATPLNGTDSYLNWETLSEFNSSHFEVERSTTGDHWLKTATVAAAENSLQANKYNLIDKDVFNPLELKEATFYYRLKMVDLDGTFEYSDVREVSFESESGFIVGEAYPNPTNRTNATVSLPVSTDTESVMEIAVYNIQGRIANIYTKELLKGNNVIEIAMDQYSAGAYFLKLTTGNLVATKKIVVQ